MPLSNRAILCGLVLATTALGEPKSPEALARDLADYRPGANVVLDRYVEAGGAFHRDWADKKPEADSKLQALLDVAEPEALLGMLSLLSANDVRTVYGSFNGNNPQPGEEIRSSDGLLGFRVVWQREWTHSSTKEKRLLSAIASYELDPETLSFNLRLAADTVRIRVEAEAFRPRKKATAARGFLGFSWLTEASPDRALRAKGQPIVLAPKYYSHQAKADEPKRSHPGMAFPGITPCGFANHCNTCHHSENRNSIPESAFREKPEASEGAQDLLEFAKSRLKLTEADLRRVEAQLADPPKTFPRKPLLDAFVARWSARKKQ